MKWSLEKNEWLKANRGITFEEIKFSVENGGLLDVIKHHNPHKYPNQHLWIVSANEYVFYVPFVENSDEIFLKTIIPSRKAVKRYLRGGRSDE